MTNGGKPVTAALSPFFRGKGLLFLPHINFVWPNKNTQPYGQLYMVKEKLLFLLPWAQKILPAAGNFPLKVLLQQAGVKAHTETRRYIWGACVMLSNFTGLCLFLWLCYCLYTLTPGKPFFYYLIIIGWQPSTEWTSELLVSLYV